MNRRAMLAKCLVHLLAVLVMAPATGCTLIGYAIGSSGESRTPSRSAREAPRMVLTETAGDEEEWNWGPSGHVRIQAPSRLTLTEAPAHRQGGSGVSWGGVGAMIGAVLDVAMIATVAVLAASWEPFSSVWPNSSDGSSSPPSTCPGILSGC